MLHSGQHTSLLAIRGAIRRAVHGTATLYIGIPIGLRCSARLEPQHRGSMSGGGSDPGIRLASPAKYLVHSYRRVTGRYRPPDHHVLKEVSHVVAYREAPQRHT